MIKTIVELTICVILFVGCIIIATEIARYGLLQIHIVIQEQLINYMALKALVVGITIILLSGILLQTLFEWKSILTKSENIQLVLKIFPVILLLWLIFFRYVKMPKGQFDHNRANIWINYWSHYYYTPGLALAEPLKSSKRVNKILSLFNKTLAVEEKGTRFFLGHRGSISIITPLNNKNIALIYLEMAFLYRMMNLYDETHNVLDKASCAIDRSLREDPENENYLGWKSSIIFHQAETYQAHGTKLQYAKELYGQCATVNNKLTGDKEIKKLMDKIDQNFMSKK